MVKTMAYVFADTVAHVLVLPAARVTPDPPARVCVPVLALRTVQYQNVPAAAPETPATIACAVGVVSVTPAPPERSSRLVSILATVRVCVAPDPVCVDGAAPMIKPPEKIGPAVFTLPVVFTVGTYVVMTVMPVSLKLYVAEPLG